MMKKIARKMCSVPIKTYTYFKIIITARAT
jgi:hypothetical protein